MLQIFDEIKQISIKTVISSFVAPIVVILILIYLFGNSQIWNTSLAIVDLDNSSYSRQLIEKFDASPYVEVTGVYYETLEPASLLIDGRYKGVVVLPADLDNNRLQGRTNNIGLVVDDTVAASVAYLRQGIAEVIAVENASSLTPKLMAMGMTQPQAAGMANSLSLQQRTPYNPTSSFVNTAFVGFGNLVIFVFLLQHCIRIIPRLREEGSWAVNCLSPFGLISRVIPYIILYMATTFLIVGLMKTYLNLRFVGGIFDFCLSLLCYMLAVSILGLIMGCLTPNLSKVTSRLIPIVAPSFLLSNLALPLVITPEPMQMLAKALPFGYFVKFWQDIGLRGATLDHLTQDFGHILIYTATLGLLLLLLLLKNIHTITKKLNSETVPESTLPNSPTVSGETAGELPVKA